LQKRNRRGTEPRGLGQRRLGREEVKERRRPANGRGVFAEQDASEWSSGWNGVEACSTGREFFQPKKKEERK